MDFVAIPFEADTQFGPYKDTLYFPSNALPPATEIEQIKQTRVDNWIAVISALASETADPPAEEPIAGNGSDG